MGRTESRWDSALAAAAILVAALFGLSLIWNLPGSMVEFEWPRLATASLEITTVFALLALARPLRHGGAAVMAAAGVGVATMVVATLRLAELGVQESLGRPLNPVLDVYLLDSLALLLTQTLGTFLGWSAIGALALVPPLACAGAFVAVRVSQRALNNRIARHATIVACAALVAVFAFHQWRDPDGRTFVENGATLTLLRHVRAARETARGIETVEAEMAADRFRDVPAAQLLAGLRGVDVLLVFIESYGRTAVDLPRNAAHVVPALADVEARLSARGLAAVSGWLTSPTVGGQSWLASGTFVSGLWLSDQGRYDVAMQSEWLTLTRAFARAGHRTVALKPAVTSPWPEGARLGFARVYAAADLGYAGKPYNWVTMPDQYTLSAMQRVEREGATRPLFAEISLISSHAPWTPVAPVLEDWTTIGDGRVFSTWAEQGDPPEVVWSDPERIRGQYPRAIDYVVRVLGSYAANFVDERTLMILVGDHQPAPLITGDDAGQDVPIHVISGDARLLAPFAAWGLVPGMRPPAELAPRSMDAFRSFFLDAFQAPVATAAAK